MIRRILVPLDGSVRAEGVLPHAAILAKTFGARLDFLHVIPAAHDGEGSCPADPFGIRMARAHWTRYLDGKAAALRLEGLEVRTRIEEGSPSGEIVDLLNRGEHDLVALSAHGTGSGRNLRLGCTAASVILNSQAGILLIPGRQASGTSANTVPYRRILAPVDCSPRSDWSLGVAGAIAHRSHASLRVVHVLDCPEVVSRLPGTEGATGFVKRLRELNRSEARRYLDEVSWRFQAQGIAVECDVVESRDAPAEALLSMTSRIGIDLVVLSAHGRGASPVWQLGGTAAKLAFWAQHPMLILQDQPVRDARIGRRLRSDHRAVAGERGTGY